MVHNPSYSTNIFEAIGIFGTLNFAEKLGEKYEQFAIPKIQEATLKLRGSLFYLKNLNAEKASKELKTFAQLMPLIEKARILVESLSEKEYVNFKVAASEFFDAFDTIQECLEDITDAHSSYRLATPVLAEDWDSKADQHWDNY